MRIGTLLGIDGKGKYSVLALPDMVYSDQIKLRKEIQTARGVIGKGKGRTALRGLVHLTSDGVKQDRFPGVVPVEDSEE